MGISVLPQAIGRRPDAANMACVNNTVDVLPSVPVTVTMGRAPPLRPDSHS